MADWTSAITNRHMNALLRHMLWVTAMVRYIEIRVPLSANNSYSHLFVDWRTLLQGYTLISAPVSTRKDVNVVLSVTKMRREPMPSSSAGFTYCWSRFPASLCTETGSCMPGLRTFGGNSNNRGFPVPLSIFLSISADFVSPGQVAASMRAFPLAVGLSVRSGR